MIILKIIAAYFLAELVSALFHWWEDRYLTADTWFFGALVGGPNVEHHKYPGRLCQSSYWVRNYTTIVPAAIAGVLCLAAGWWTLALACLFVSQANEIHSWAHQRCSWPIRMLQELGIFQSPRHHKVHHTRPFSRYYCVMSNYLNPVLDWLDVWSLLEDLVRLVTGIRPIPEREIA